MEKYLVIIMIAIVLYTVYNSCSITEGFADAQTIDGVDESNAINTLAKIAKDLQEGGGLKVKGALNVDGAVNLAGALNVSGDMSQKNINFVKGADPNRFIFHTPNDDRKGMWIVPAKDDAASDWLWGTGLNLKRDGNHTLGGNLNTTGNLNTSGELKVTGKTTVSNLDVTGKITANGLGFVYLFFLLGGNWVAPIRDLQGNTFPADKWVCTTNFVHAEGKYWNGGVSFVGSDNNWWVLNPEGSNWQQVQIILMPKSLFGYVSKPRFDYYKTPNKGGGLYIMDENGNRVAHPNP